MQTRRLSRLIKNLSHCDAARRRQAAEGLSDADERAVYPLIKALGDDNAGVHEAAMRSLVSLGGEGTSYMMLPLLRENALLRNTAISILREIGSTAVAVLYPLLNDKDDDLRKFSIDLMTDIKDGVSPERIVRLINDPNANVRASVAEAVGRLGYQEAVPHLIEALHDEEWVCFSALEALGELKDDAAVDPIAKLLMTGSETLRYAAIEALGSIGSEPSREVLINHLSKAEGGEKNSVIKSLLKTGTTPLIPGLAGFLMDMFKNGDWEEKLVALKGIVDLKEFGAAKTIIDIGGSLDPSAPDSEDLLLRIRESLLSLGCAGVFIDILNDPSVKYRGRVITIEILGELQSRKAVPHLIKLLDSDLTDIRRASIKALGNIQHEGAAEALIGSLEDYDGHVRRAAIVALGRIGERAAFGPISELLRREKYRDVLEEAVKALLMIDSEEFFACLDGFGPAVRELAGWHGKDFHEYHSP